MCAVNLTFSISQKTNPGMKLLRMYVSTDLAVSASTAEVHIKYVFVLALPFFFF